MSKAEMLKAISVRPLLLSFVRGVEDLYDTSTEQPAKVCRNASFSELFDNQNDIFVPRQARDNGTLKKRRCVFLSHSYIGAVRLRWHAEPRCGQKTHLHRLFKTDLFAKTGSGQATTGGKKRALKRREAVCFSYQGMRKRITFRLSVATCSAYANLLIHSIQSINSLDPISSLIHSIQSILIH